jgi:hypothetical protein
LRVVAGLALALPASSACLQRAPETTGVRIVVTWTGFDPDQLAFALALEDGTPLGDTERRPAQPAGPLASGSAVVVYLGQYRSGQLVRCSVEALSAGQVIGVGTGLATVVGLEVVDLQVPVTSILGPAPHPETIPDGSIPASTPDATASDEAGPVIDAGESVVPPSPDATPGIDAAGIGDATVSPPSDLPPAVPDASPPVDLPPDGPSAPKARGERCGASGECASGHCSDGVCCMEACTGPCRSCAGPQAGTCTLTVPGLADPRQMCAASPAGSCGTTGTCNGQGACVYHPAGIVCAAASCDQNNQRYRAPSLCDGKGACVPGVSVSCRPYRCENASCYISCTTNAQCWGNSHCENGRCQ